MIEDPHAKLKKHILTPERVRELAALKHVAGVKVGISRKERKRREQFVIVPWTWANKLNGATGQTYRVALVLLYEHWRRGGEAVKFNNHIVESYNVSRQSKWRALVDLERRGLISVERRPSRSPIIHLKVSHP